MPYLESLSTLTIPGPATGIRSAGRLRRCHVRKIQNTLHTERDRPCAVDIPVQVRLGEFPRRFLRIVPTSIHADPDIVSMPEQRESLANTNRTSVQFERGMMNPDSDQLRRNGDRTTSY